MFITFESKSFFHKNPSQSYETGASQEFFSVASAFSPFSYFACLSYSSNDNFPILTSKIVVKNLSKSAQFHPKTT
jgi:hypothetical protein